MFLIVSGSEQNAKSCPHYTASPSGYIWLVFSKQIRFCLQDGTKDIVGKYPNPTFPSLWSLKCYAEENPACLLNDQDSTALKQCGFSCLPPNLINRWVMSIKRLSAGRQSSLASFKQLQCPSCSRASLCQRERGARGTPHVWIRVLSLSVDPVCSAAGLLALTGTEQFRSFRYKVRRENRNKSS